MSDKTFEPYAVYGYGVKVSGYPPFDSKYAIIEVALQRARELIAEGAEMVRVYDHSKDEGETLIFEFPDQRLREKMRETKRASIELSIEEAEQVLTQNLYDNDEELYNKISAFVREAGKTQ